MDNCSHQDTQQNYNELLELILKNKFHIETLTNQLQSLRNILDKNTYNEKLYSIAEKIEIKRGIFSNKDRAIKVLSKKVTKELKNV